MTQDELKIAVGKAAADHVAENSPEGCIIGVGTGSTANCFIDALATFRTRLKGAIASSEATKRRLESHGIVVFDLNDIDDLPFYVDGADEIDAGLNMIKGGGGALTRRRSSRRSRGSSSASPTVQRRWRRWAGFPCRSRSFRWLALTSPVN